MSAEQLKDTDDLNGIIASLRSRKRFGTTLLPNPDPILARERKNISLFRSTEYDAEVEAVVGSRKAGTQKKKIRLVDNGASPEVLQFIRRNFDALDMNALIEKILDTPLYGYSVFEILWRSDTRHHNITDVSYKPQDWFAWDINKQLRYLTIYNSIQGDLCPYRKFLVAQHKPTYENPYGRALLGQCYWYVEIKKAMFQYWTQFGEKYGTPYIHAGMPLNAKKDAYEDTLDMLDALAADGVIVLPESIKLTLIEAQRSSTSEVYEQLIRMCDAQISKAILGHAAAADATAGRLGGEENANAVRDDLIEADSRMVEKTLNQLIRYAVDVNFYTSAYPKVELLSPESLDAARATRDQQLFAIGVRFTPEYFRGHYQLKTTEFTVTDSAATSYPPFKEHIHNEAITVVTPDQKVIDKAVDELLESEQLSGESKQVISRIVNRVLAGDNYEDILSGLEKQFREADTAKFEELLGNALFVADAIGRISQEREVADVD